MLSYYLYGKHASLAALNNTNRKILSVLCTKKVYQNHEKLIGKYPHKIIESNYLDKILGNLTHQDIALKVSPITKFTFDEINLNSPNCKIAILDQISDPHNIGAIIRSAAAFNLSAIIVPNNNFPNENGIIAKVASGGLEKVSILSVTNLVSAINCLKNHGFWVVGFDSEVPQEVKSENLHGKVCMVLGAEGKGIRRLVKENCDLLLKISLPNISIGSLNVSSAAAIIFYLSS